jgi:hypothetical protein
MQHSSGHQSLHQIIVTTRSLFIEITLTVVEKQNTSIHLLAFIFFFSFRCRQEPFRGEKSLSNPIGHYSTLRFVCPETNLGHVYMCIVC